MNRSLFGALGVIAALTAVVSCKEDPLSDFDGSPAHLVTDFNHLRLPIGDTIAVTASVLDGRASALPIPVTFTACNANVTAAVDTSYHPVPATSSRGLVIGNAAAPSCVVVRGGGLEDTIVVTAVPDVFTGVISNLAPLGGDTVTIASTAVLKFNPATVSIAFEGGHAATILSATADAVVFLAPFAGAGPLTLGGILINTYDPDLEISGLETSQNVTQTGDLWGPGDTSFATAPTIPIPATAGTSIRMLTTFEARPNNTNCAEFGLPAGPAFSTGPCVIYEFTLAAPTALSFETNWGTTADIDIYVCDDSGLAGCFESGGSGAGSAKPEVVAPFTYAAGTHYFVIEVFRPPQPANLYITITRP